MGRRAFPGVKPIAPVPLEIPFRDLPSRSGRFRKVLVSSWSHFAGPNRVQRMADAAQVKARKAIRKAQSDFERSQERHEQIRENRRKSFEQAQAAGLSTREIAEETGLHFTRVARIIQAKP
jgi:DNA invertase Pin-like site-specific DNA recombinase